MATSEARFTLEVGALVRSTLISKIKTLLTDELMR